MLQLKNETPFGAELMLLADKQGVDTLFTVVKATFTIGESLSVAEKQVPVTLADEHYGEPEVSSIRTPSDVALHKPGTDVLIIGSACAPDERPVWHMDVSASVGSVSKTVRVFGDRVWNQNGPAATMEWVAPFVRMPLVWERAFGGSDITDAGPAAEPRNPVGTGFRASGGRKAMAGAPVPNVEDPWALITGPGDAPAPAGMAAIAPAWLPRRAFAGTYDDQWQQSRAPYLPEDFDLRFFQVAAPGMVSSRPLVGGEPVRLRGFTPGGSLDFYLPVLTVRATYHVDRATEQRPAVLDTVVVAPDEHRLVMLWRASLPCDKKVLKVREVTVEAAAGLGRYIA